MPLPAGRTAARCLAALLLAITIAIPTCTLTGCATFTGEGATLRRVTTAAKVAANTGTFLYLQKHPETRPAFILARDQLLQIEASEHVDLALLLSIVQRLPVDRLESPVAQLLISNATIIITDFAGSLPLDQLDNLKPVAAALREGIDLGLGTGFSEVPK